MDSGVNKLLNMHQIYAPVTAAKNGRLPFGANLLICAPRMKMQIAELVEPLRQAFRQ